MLLSPDTLLLLCYARDTLDGLRSVGFRLFDGINGTGSSLLARIKAGGYYLGTNSLARLQVKVPFS